MEPNTSGCLLGMRAEPSERSTMCVWVHRTCATKAGPKSDRAGCIARCILSETAFRLCFTVKQLCFSTRGVNAPHVPEISWPECRIHISISYRDGGFRLVIPVVPSGHTNASVSLCFAIHVPGKAGGVELDHHSGAN